MEAGEGWYLKQLKGEQIELKSRKPGKVIWFDGRVVPAAIPNYNFIGESGQEQKPDCCISLLKGSFESLPWP